MLAVIMQFVSHPRPGRDLATILQLAKDGATLWRKHGASLKLGARLIPPRPQVYLGMVTSYLRAMAPTQCLVLPIHPE